MSQNKMSGVDDLNPSTVGSGKRLKEDEDKPDHEDASRKRAKTAPDVSSEKAIPKRTLSLEFYYPDGNITVIVENTEFCLHLSRLMKHCTLFSRLWRLVEAQDDEIDTTLVESTPDAIIRDHRRAARPRRRQHPEPIAHEGNDSEEDQREIVASTGEARHVLKGVSAADFTEFLRAFENPLMYTSTSPKQSTSISLLRVASQLGCETVLKVAKDRLRSLWPLKIPSRDSKSKILSNVNALTIIALAREFLIPELLRKAFYEVLRNPSFWEAVVTKRHSVKILDADLLNLYHAREVLQREWRVLLLAPPGATCLSPVDQPEQCVYTSRVQRAAYWRSHFIETAELEKGAADPVCYVDTLLDGPFFQQPNGTWCEACLADRKAAWRAAKTQWWDMLDGLFKITVNAAI